MFRKLSAVLALSSAILVEGAVPCPYADGSIVTLPGGAQYEIHCGLDYFTTQNLAFLNTPDFPSCFAACQQNSQCLSVSYRGSGCYLKGAPQPGGIADPDVLSAIRVYPLSCPFIDQSIYTAPGTAARFQIQCQTDHFITTNLFAKDFATFAECVNYCASYPGCAAVSFRGAGCYGKSSPVPAASFDAGVTSAILLPPPTATPTIAPTVAPTVAPTQPPPTCPYTNGFIYYIPGTYGAFKVECGIDHFTTTNLAQLDTATFEQCIGACQADSRCAAVSYRGAGCYLKSNPVPGDVVDSGVTSAIRVRYPCPYGNGIIQVIGGRTYLIKVDFDFFTISNLAQTDVATFDACAIACNGNSGCAGFSMRGSGCYLKSFPLPTGVPSVGVYSAQLLY